VREKPAVEEEAWWALIESACRQNDVDPFDISEYVDYRWQRFLVNKLGSCKKGVTDGHDRQALQRQFVTLEGRGGSREESEDEDFVVAEQNQPPEVERIVELRNED